MQPNTFNARKTNSPLEPVLIKSDLPSVIQYIFIIYFVRIGLILIDLTYSQSQTFCNLYASSQKYYANIKLLIKFKIMIILLDKPTA